MITKLEFERLNILDAYLEKIYWKPVITDIASGWGVNLATASNKLSNWDIMGVIKRDNGGIEIIDVDFLKWKEENKQ